MDKKKTSQRLKQAANGARLEQAFSIESEPANDVPITTANGAPIRKARRTRKPKAQISKAE